MRTASRLWIVAIMGILASLLASSPASADSPGTHQTSVRFTVDNAADIRDANPGDGRCQIPVQDTDNSNDKTTSTTLPKGGKDTPFKTIPTLYPPITKPAPVEPAGRCTLRAAVEESNANFREPHIVTLPATLGVYVLTRGELYVRGHLDVVRDFSEGSKRSAINARHRSRIFNVASNGFLALDGLFLAQGNVDFVPGGAVAISRGATAQIDRSVIVNSHARSGGAVYVRSGGHLDARYTSFESNRADEWGGAIYAVGSVNLDRVSVYNNTAEHGGGIYVETREESGFWMENSSVIDNTANDSGGGLYYRGQGFVGLLHATISANAADHGGGIYNHRTSAPLLLAYSLLAGNVDTEDPSDINASPDCDGQMSTDGVNLFGAISGRCWGYDVSQDVRGNVRRPLDPSLELVRISTDGNSRGDGGELAYRRPAFNSPALDVIPANRCVTDNDMIRSNARSGEPCDLGAIER